MNAIVLCPGPSLSQFRGRHGSELLIGVNRAATKWNCSVWAAGDYPLIEKERDRVIGEPTLFTAAASSAHVRDHCRPWPAKVVEFETLHGFCDVALQWELFTGLAALVFAAWVGADAIVLYGADWSGQADFDGAENSGNRSPERWKLESEIFTNRMVPWLKGRGIDTTRHLIPH